MTEKSNFLIQGQNCFTQLGLFKATANFKKLTLKEGTSYCSASLKTYQIDADLLNCLDKKGYNYVHDHKIELGKKGYSGWSFNKDKPQIEIWIKFEISTRKRGVELIPAASASFSSPVDRDPHRKMFCDLVDCDDNAPQIAKEIADNNGVLVVSWTDLGLGGLRRLADLFFEFARDREEIRKLADKLGIFDPLPWPRFTQKDNDEIYVIEPAQPKLFEIWAQQLENFSNKIRRT